ncbi:coproporphyrinogen III oxidase [Pseudomonas stutzeri]|uniref:Coproporphyrinogen-III oxidase n=1 Tax=Stutzerimonas stutzeri TaxID=316 RepID=A0A2N8RZP6_STUST|nr:coproporphyrinogen III oxidase [Stutzerimonas stutzeri]MCQ4295191.1 coproporphyrinogen III oxidase [Stutzerimonas stutzeri]PNF79857.1 coproporphyrinogen III oxidase [Stutzerimonas stutzeri]
MLGSVTWDDALVQRYGQIGQQQCTYPSAVDFTDRIAPLDLLRALRQSRRAGRPLSIAIHQPGGVELAPGEAADYQLRLEREIEQLGCHVGPMQQVQQLRLSVGSLGIEALRRLVTQLKARFNFVDPRAGSFLAEVELAHVDWPLIGALHELGFNQLSVAVPDLRADDGGTVEYFRSSARIRAVIEAAHALHYRSVNLDLGYGRSWQTPASFARKLASIIELAPDQVTMFDYRDAAPLASSGPTRLGLASVADTLAMYRYGVEQLGAAGYRYIGLGKFVLPHDDLAMAQEIGALYHDIHGYTLHGDCDHLGFGAGAISRVGALYCQNTSSAQVYQQTLDQDQLPSAYGLHADHVDLLHRMLLESLRCSFALDFDTLTANSGVDMPQRYAPHWPALEHLHAQGVIVLEEGGLSIPSHARLLLPAVCAAFEQPSAMAVGHSAGHGRHG